MPIEDLVRRALSLMEGEETAPAALYSLAGPDVRRNAAHAPWAKFPYDWFREPVADGTEKPPSFLPGIETFREGKLRGNVMID